MSTEQSSTRAARAAVHAALGEPTRLGIVDQLLLGDASPGDMGRRLGMPSNLLAHHLDILAAAGLVHRSRSEGDRRRSYLHLRFGALDGLIVTPQLATARVVFVCTHNAARSQLAAALWQRRSIVPATSAGTRPGARINPLARAAARRQGLQLGRGRPRHVADVLRPDDLVIAVCDNAHEALGSAPGRIHWSVPDPSRSGQPAAFAAALDDLSARIHRLAPSVVPFPVPPGDDR